MAEYADRIAGLPLFQELERSVGRDGASASDVKKLAGLVSDAADAVGPLLKRIPVTFTQYTEHDITHSTNVIRLTGSFIPTKTLKAMSGVELALLLLAALTHDLGMVVSDNEKEALLGSREFAAFQSSHLDRQQAAEEARSQGQPHRARMIEDALLADLLRRAHAERVRGSIQRAFPQGLSFSNIDLSPDLVLLCESHAWGIRESQDSRDSGKAVAQLPYDALVLDYSLNLRYLSCCLRLADILDFDSSRTPLAVFRQMDFTEDRSWQEWVKHLQVRGKSVTQNKVRYACAFTHTALYVAANEYLDSVDAELRECRYLIDELPKEMAERYRLDLPHAVDRRQVRMADPRHIAGAFRFQLEYDDIMRLLMDKSLYPDASLFLRELLQNSLDACRHKEARWKEAGRPGKYKPRIVVWDHSDDPSDPRIVFQDNGMGMSLEIVENYFMRVGRSYYRSPAFEGERQRLAARKVDLDACSSFGIGVLSCFLVADRFEVETYRFGHDPLRITIEGPGKYFLIERLDRPSASEFPLAPRPDAESGPPHETGTRVTLHMKPGARVDARQALDTFAANVEYDVRTYASGRQRPRITRARRWSSADIRLVATPESIGHAASSPALAAGLGEVLVASRIPLEEWQFSRHLEGQAWFWLLRGPSGDPCPETGYLRVWSAPHRAAVGLRGFAAYIEALARRVGTSPPLSQGEPLRWGDVLAALRGRSAASEKRVLHILERDRHARVGADVRTTWAQVEADERAAFATLIEAYSKTRRSRDLPFWPLVPGLPARMARGRLGAHCDLFRLGLIGVRGGEMRFAHPVQRLALHGILVPGGVATWNPAAGSAKQVEFALGFGGLMLDARTSAAPLPSSSRLFVDQSEGAKIAVPYMRAALRHAAHLVCSGGGSAEWRRWFGDMAGSWFGVPFSAPPFFVPGPYLEGPGYGYLRCAVAHELPYLEERIPYVVAIGRQRLPMMRDEVVRQFGTKAPLSLQRDGLAIGTVDRIEGNPMPYLRAVATGHDMSMGFLDMG